YERGALKRCEKAGIEARRVLLPADASQDELLAAIKDINADPAVHGCLVFRPLPAGLDEDAVAAALDPAKDVDSMTPASLLTTLSGRGEGFAPCTAEAVLALLDHYGVELDGAKVAVVGRSLVIGRPVAAMLTARNATVTTCHTHTRDLAAECRAADVVVAAVGRARTIGADAVREGQTIIDVGINWDEAAGKLVGDVDFDAAEPVVNAITPVPGGVGAVTTAILAKHVIEAAERASK
ncbi:MAG: bifunctional 5,10-methylenetetrahydrofolate dehydrogenase/5,10-methenyltetrahydrofolate cyclohydrolase, partial [Collinsella sp.]|nr:bifunctional 5,10-methylenetetrahydrofolate dehydrogenase/5,10-methenyltetrahydrofolate cyclohydrolase [Collinsella sp.]